MTGGRTCSVAAALYWVAAAVVLGMIIYVTRQVDLWLYLFILIVFAMGIGYTMTSIGAQLPIVAISEPDTSDIEERLRKLEQELREVKKAVEVIRKYLEE